MQVAQGSVVSDADGTRQATLLFAPGTQALMVFANESTQPLSTLSLRATEYSVGALGPLAMPQLLPPTSAYTYAVEISADEAIAAGAEHIVLSQPAIFYLENFLGFDAGLSVPIGVYDRERGAWIPQPNGRVINVVGETAGLADVDTNGDAIADDAATLAALGITNQEREKLAELYDAPVSLWRTPLSRFSPVDCNFPGDCPEGEDCSDPDPDGDDDDDDDDDNCDDLTSSRVEIQNQILHESVGIVGTPYEIVYSSDRVPGRKIAYAVDVRLTGPIVSGALAFIDWHVDVAGRRFSESLDCEQPGACVPDIVETFIWDGIDRYGRTVNGGQRAKITVDYIYEGFYASTTSFGSFGDDPTTVPLRGFFKKSASFETTLGTWREDLQGLGGWSLSVHHAYDPVAQRLYLGDGRRRSTIPLSIHTIGGGGSCCNLNEGGPAIGAWMGPWGADVAADGSILFADPTSATIRKIDPDGIITRVAGTPNLAGFQGDGGPATQARINFPRDVDIAPDGSLFLVDQLNRRIRRVDGSGIITTVAGNGSLAFSGEGGPATQAGIGEPRGVVVAADGSFYIAAHGNPGRIMRVAPDGILTRIAGGGGFTLPPPAAPPTDLFIDQVTSVDLGADGSVYFTDDSSFAGRKVWRVNPQGELTRIAGVPGQSGVIGDGGPALQARLQGLFSIAVAPDDTIYLVADVTSGVFAPAITAGMRVITPDGIIHKFVGRFDQAGFSGQGFVGEGGPAAAAFVVVPRSVALGPPGIGGVYLTDSTDGSIFHIRPPLPGFSASQILIPSEDGSEAYVFDAVGQTPRDAPRPPRHHALRLQLRSRRPPRGRDQRRRPRHHRRARQRGPPDRHRCTLWSTDSSDATSGRDAVFDHQPQQRSHLAHVRA